MIVLSGSETMTQTELAGLLGIRVDSMLRDLRAGRILAPIVDRRKTKIWDRKEVENWLNAGGPRNDVWQRAKRGQ